MRVIFMGTPDLAVSILKAIKEAGHDIVLVVTQEDKKKGRGKELAPPPVKEYALAHNLPVFQPHSMKEESREALKNYDADIFVVAAYGQILTKEVLMMPKYGCINVHTSLLPKYRGAAPIQWAIIDGLTKTGVTIMQMDEGLDTGDILFTKEVEITDTETGGSLHDKLAEAGAELIVEALEKIEAHEVTPVKQKDEESCYARKLEKALGRIDFHKSAVELDRLVRGLYPWPGTYTSYHGKNLKIFDCIPCEKQGDGTPGTIVKVTKDAIYVATASDTVRISDVQMEGKKRMPMKEFLLGVKMQEGEILGIS